MGCMIEEIKVDGKKLKVGDEFVWKCPSMRGTTEKLEYMYVDDGVRLRMFNEFKGEADIHLSQLLEVIQEGELVREFAFGRDVVDGFECPATSVDGTSQDTVAPWYDSVLRDETGDTCGVVDEELAKDAWIKGIWFYAYKDGSRAKDSVKIARELGWLE